MFTDDEGIIELIDISDWLNSLEVVDEVYEN